MAYEMNDNSGSLFKNKNKTKDSQPDYTGTAKIQSQNVRVAGWKKESLSGITYLSLAFTPIVEEEVESKSQSNTDDNDDW